MCVNRCCFRNWNQLFHNIKHNQYGDIVYLSSHGRKTLIHTEYKDYETGQLLKEIERKLPREDFIRIHKRFIVNLKYISRLQYYQGGRYLLYLKDEDENTLPVGPTYTNVLKEKLGI